MQKVDFYSTKQVSELTGVGLKTIQEWAKTGRMPGQIRMGHFWMFRKEEIDDALTRESFLNEALPV